MSIYIWADKLKDVYIGANKAKEVYVWTTKVRPTIYNWPELCFTANTAWSTVALNKKWSPSAVTLEITTDGSWSTYTIWDVITLNNVWDKVFFRNTSTSNTYFTIDINNYYKFVMTWSIAWSGDITSLINKNRTIAIPNTCFYYLFWDCTSLTTPPELPATTIGIQCYTYMFRNCSNLEALPSLPSTQILKQSYAAMFYNCSKIKISQYQTWEYQTPYRIPPTWTASTGSNSLAGMFLNTWWTFTWTPSENTTYYTSNTVI